MTNQYENWFFLLNDGVLDGCKWDCVSVTSIIIRRSELWACGMLRSSFNLFEHFYLSPHHRWDVVISFSGLPFILFLTSLLMFPFSSLKGVTNFSLGQNPPLGYRWHYVPRITRSPGVRSSRRASKVFSWTNRCDWSISRCCSIRLNISSISEVLCSFMVRALALQMGTLLRLHLLPHYNYDVQGTILISPIWIRFLRRSSHLNHRNED